MLQKWWSKGNNSKQHKVELWFFHSALYIISTNTNAKFQVNQTRDDKVMLQTNNWTLQTCLPGCMLAQPPTRMPWDIPVFARLIKRNGGYQHFLFFKQCFVKAFSFGCQMSSLLMIQDKLKTLLQTTFLASYLILLLHNFCFLYARRRRDLLCYHLWLAGGRASPILCPEHISKTMLPTVMKLHGWIDLIKAECSAQEP